MRVGTSAVVARLVACGLVSIAVVGTWKAVADLPAISTPSPNVGPNISGVTWHGYGLAAAYGLGFLLVIFIYAGKRWIIRFDPRAPARILWFCLGVASSLPYIWFLVVVDWQNRFVYPVSCWVYDPIAVWAIPTLSFAWDVGKGVPSTTEAYLIRSAVEIVLVVPIWVVLWTFFSFFFLGGGWI